MNIYKEIVVCAINKRHCLFLRISKLCINMLENSFDSIFLKPGAGHQDIEYWRDKIQRNIKKYGSRDRNRNKSCEIVEDLAQISVICKYLRSERKPTRKRVKCIEKQFTSFERSAEVESELSSSSQHTNASTPLSHKSGSKNKDMHLVTFRPGEDWSDCVKPRRPFPRDIFTNKKLF